MMRRIVLSFVSFVALVLVVAAFTSCKRKASSGEVKLIGEKENITDQSDYDHIINDTINDTYTYLFLDNDMITEQDVDNFIYVDDDELLPLEIWDNGILLETLTTNDGYTTEMWKFEYDDKQRFIKLFHYQNGELITTKTLTYNGDELVKMEENNIETYFIRNGNIITLTTDPDSDYKDIITLNKNGFIAITKTIYDQYDTSGTANPTIAYYYRGGNLIEAKGLSGPHWMSSEYFIFYRYDNKKTPFNCKTPKWFLQHYLEKEIGLKNNATKINFSSHHVNISTSFVYEFDNDGFPTKRRETRIYDGDYEYAETITTSFKYRDFN